MIRLRSFLWRLMGEVSFWSGIGPALAWARRRWNPGSWTIVTYHRLGPPVPDGGPDPVSPERFRRQLRFYRARYDVVTMSEALERIDSPTPPRRALLTITFDDGYRDNLTTALPILREEGCSATLFVTVEAVREGVPAWPHRLAADLLGLRPDSGSRPEGETDAAWNHLVPLLPALGRGRQPGVKEVLRVLDKVKGLPPRLRRRVCDAASHLSGGAGRNSASMLSLEELREWAGRGMEVGAHTLTHPILPLLPGRDRLPELREARAILEEWLGRPVLHMAYPNGEWDEATLREIREAGYLAAVTTEEGINPPDADRFRLRRIAVTDESFAVFAMRVSGLFSGLRMLFKRGPGAPSAPERAAPESRPLRVAFIGGRGVGGAYSGIERYYEEVGSRLADRGHEVLAYCRSHFSPDAPTYRGLRLIRHSSLRTKHLETLIHSLLATLDVCFRRVDLVQFHALGSSPLAWIPRLFGKRTVVSVRGLDWQRGKWGAVARGYLRFCEDTALRCPNATVVVSRTLGHYFRARHGRRVICIPNGVSRMEPRPADAISQWNLVPRGYFLYAGRLSPEKDLETLIEGHKGMEGSSRLVIAGGSSYSDQHIRHLQALAGPEVVFTGFLTGDAIQDLYGNALAFVLPSKMEGLSVALLEAMAHGLPVVVSDIPENRELVEACGGRIFPQGDSVALRRILKEMTADPNGAMDLGRRIQDRVRTLFSWDRITEETEDLYRLVTGGRG